VGGFRLVARQSFRRSELAEARYTRKAAQLGQDPTNDNVITHLTLKTDFAQAEVDKQQRLKEIEYKGTVQVPYVVD